MPLSSFADAGCGRRERGDGLPLGPAMCCVFVLVGVHLSVGTGFFQLRNWAWLRLTIGSLFVRKGGNRRRARQNSISPFQALATALAATTGTGNIVGVATAIVSGGPGAVFWMWISAFFGMMTKYAEIALSMKYRYRNAAGEWMGGPMVFLSAASPPVARRAFFRVLPARIVRNRQHEPGQFCVGRARLRLRRPGLGDGRRHRPLCGTVMLGGIRRIGAVAGENRALYGRSVHSGRADDHRGQLPRILPAFRDIFAGAFGLRAAGGGVLGYTVASSMRLRRRPRHFLQRGRPRLVRHRPLRDAHQGTGAAGHVGRVRGLCRHHRRLHPLRRSACS